MPKTISKFVFSFFCPVTLLTIQVGLIGGWTSPNLARLIRPESPIHLNASQASWVGALIEMGGTCGCFLGSISLNRYGSRQSIINTSILVGLGWLGIILANSPEWLYAARLTSGFGLGMILSVFPIYVGEVAVAETRGSLMSMTQMGFPFGVLLASACDSIFSMKVSSIIYLTLCILMLFTFSKLPESPYHLVKIGNTNSARNAINWYRSGKDVEEELASVERFISSSKKGSLLKQMQEFKKPQVRMAMLQVVVLLSFMQLCGLNSISFNMENILKRSKFELCKRAHLVIFISATGIFATALSIFLVDRFGRRILITISSIGVSASLLILIIHHHFIRTNVDVENLQWLPVVSLTLYVCFVYVGIVPVPNTSVGEMLPSSNRYLCVFIVGLTGTAMSFLTTKTFQPLLDFIGDMYTFLIYMIFSLLIVPYAVFFMMENKGKSLQQIQEELLQKYSLKEIRRDSIIQGEVKPVEKHAV